MDKIDYQKYIEATYEFLNGKFTLPKMTPASLKVNKKLFYIMFLVFGPVFSLMAILVFKQSSTELINLIFNILSLLLVIGITICNIMLLRTIDKNDSKFLYYRILIFWYLLLVGIIGMILMFGNILGQFVTYGVVISTVIFSGITILTVIIAKVNFKKILPKSKFKYGQSFQGLGITGILIIGGLRVINPTWASIVFLIVAGIILPIILSWLVQAIVWQMMVINNYRDKINSNQYYLDNGYNIKTGEMIK